MIFDNSKISKRQRNRISFWYVFGAGIVFLPTLLLKICKESMMPCLLAGYALFVVVTLIKSAADRSEKKKTKQQKNKKVLVCIKRIYCLAEGIVLLYALLELVIYRLVPQERKICIFLMLLFLVIYAGWNGLECFARGAEVLFVPWLAGIVITAAVLYVHIFSDGFLTAERAAALVRPFSFSGETILGVLLSFFVFFRVHFCFEKGEESITAKLFPGAMLVILMIGAVWFHGIMGMQSTPYEMLSLVYTGRGNTLLSSLWILGILYAASYDLTIAFFWWEQKKMEEKKGNILLAKVIFTAVFAAAILGTHGKKPISIESREYATAQCIGKADSLKISYLFPEMKGSPSKNEDSGEKKSVFQTEADSLDEAEQIFQEYSEKSVDFRHLQCVILEESVVRDEKTMELLVNDWKNEGKYERNAYVFCCRDINEILKMEGELETSLGQYLNTRMTKLKEMNGKETIRLGKMMDLFYEGKLNREEISTLSEELLIS